jgi:2-iminobutanoate/2-iminopropanoate deaminase
MRAENLLLSALLALVATAATRAEDVINTESAPRPVAPYSQAVVAGDTVYLAGQVALDPATGEFRAGTVAEETQQTLRNMEAILKASGLSLDNLVSVTIFMTDLDQYAAMNEVYGAFFPARKPARATVEVTGLPLGAKIEISGIASGIIGPR